METPKGIFSALDHKVTVEQENKTMIYTYIYKLVTEEPYITQEKRNLQVQFCRNIGKTPHYTVATEQFTTQVRTKDLIQN